MGKFEQESLGENWAEYALRDKMIVLVFLSKTVSALNIPPGGHCGDLLIPGGSQR